MSGSPTWREIDAIRTGKSDIDLAERIWQLERQLAEARAAQVPDEHLVLRPEVAAFARAMETQLRKNDWKGHWRHCTGTYLFNRLRGEVNELSRASTADRLKEAADVANFAMMIADNAARRL